MPGNSGTTPSKTPMSGSVCTNILRRANLTKARRPRRKKRSQTSRNRQPRRRIELGHQRLEPEAQVCTDHTEPRIRKRPDRFPGDIMIDLSTQYLGLNLRTPLVSSASPITQEISNIRRLEDAGASAI